MATTLNVTEEKNNEGLHLTKMPAELQSKVEKLGLDKDGDGKIDHKELGTLVDRYADSKKDNKLLRHLVTVLVIFSILLTGGVFGASIAAARLSKETTVDSSGIMYAKDSNRPIQTEPVAIRHTDVKVIELAKEELDVLDEISLDNGTMKFQVKGYARSSEKKQVILLVEGGSLIYGKEGLVAVTGMAETMFHLVYPHDDAVSVEEGVRHTLRKLNQDEKQNPKTVSKKQIFPCPPKYTGRMATPGCKGSYWCLDKIKTGPILECEDQFLFSEETQGCELEGHVECLTTGNLLGNFNYDMTSYGAF